MGRDDLRHRGFLETLDDPLGTGAFRDAVMAAGNDTQWCQRDYYSGSLDDQLGDDWDHFVETVKYQARYVSLARRQRQARA